METKTRNLYISLEADTVLASEFTKNCKDNGYLPVKVLKYIIEHPEYLEELCESIRLADIKKINEAKKLKEKLAEKGNRRGTAYTIKNTTSERTFGDMLDDFNISVVFFFCYLYLNKSLVDDLCNKLPEELKMKKCRK